MENWYHIMSVCLRVRVYNVIKNNVFLWDSKNSKNVAKKTKHESYILTQTLSRLTFNTMTCVTTSVQFTSFE